MRNQSPCHSKQSLGVKLTNFNRLSYRKIKRMIFFRLITIIRRKMAEILTVSRKSHHPIETLY